jgi:hypothetical protein
MKGLYDGKLFIKAKKEAREAIKEVHVIVIRGELQFLPVNKIVWNRDDLTQQLPERYKNNFIDNAYNFYIIDFSQYTHLIDLILACLWNCYEYNHNIVEFQTINFPLHKPSNPLTQTNRVSIIPSKKDILLGGFYIPKDETLKSNLYDKA